MITLFLIILAGVFNACMDVLDFHFSNSIFSKCKHQQWIDPSISWKNKWEDGDPAKGEAFFGSSTFLVFITNMWHFCKFLMLLLIFSSIVFYKPMINWWVDWIIFYVAFTFIFELFYSVILIKKS